MRRTLLVLALAIAGTLPLSAQQPDAQQPGCCQADSMAQRPGMKMGMNHAAGGGMDHAMMMRMDSLGTRLDSLALAMNRASGSRKVEAIAALLTALVSDHRAMQRQMHERMMQQHGMGQGGMDHGAMGMGQGPADGRMKCPMMGKPAGDGPAVQPAPQHDHSQPNH